MTVSGTADGAAASAAGSSSETRERHCENPRGFCGGKQPARAGPASSAELQHHVTFLCLRDGIGEFLELGNEEPIHIVRVGVETPRRLEGRVEATVLEPAGGSGGRSDTTPLLKPGHQGAVTCAACDLARTW